MNTNDLFEAQLRSWGPRRPSARLEEQIFGPAAEPVSAARKGVRWFAPAAIGLMVICLVHNQERSAAFSNESIGIMAMISSNQSSATYLPGRLARGRNTVWSGTFDWTNHGNSTSSIRSLPLHGRSTHP